MLIKTRLALLSLILSGGAAFAAGQGGAAKPGHQDSAKSAQPDDSARNKADNHGGPANADMQSGDEADVKTTAAIRRAITDDKSLSVYAHNVKIVTRSGKVELVGPVRSEKEKAAVEGIAEKVAGKPNVTSAITVAPSGK